jgi:hypothetical protein
MQKTLTQMNLQLHRVISDLTGITGMAIIRAIVAGERNPQILAALKNSRIKSSASELAKALTGDSRVEHIFVLQQELQLYEVYQKAIAECDRQVEQCLAQFSDQVDFIYRRLLLGVCPCFDPKSILLYFSPRLINIFTSQDKKIK